MNIVENIFFNTPYSEHADHWLNALSFGDTPISVQIITKDEEFQLPRLLASLIPLKPAEVIVGDTGSSDKTKAIAKWFGCNVFDIEWQDHFAEARNAVCDESEQPWCFWIDADEELTESSAKALRKKILQKKLVSDHNLIRFTEPPLSMYQMRLWKRVPGEKPWRGRVHEKIWMDGKDPDVHQDIVVIQHSDERRPKKLERNMALLNKAMKEEPDNHYNIFHAAVLSNMMDKHEDSQKYAEKYMYLAPREDIKTKLYMQQLLAWNATFVHRDYQRAVNLLASAISVDPCAAEFWCLLGDVYWWIGRKSDAFVFYENALCLGQAHPASFWLVDLRKYDEYPRSQLEKLKAQGIQRAKMPQISFGPEVSG
jgi:glycosyltransferase involved in cell wall biosynthesis